MVPGRTVRHERERSAICRSTRCRSSSVAARICRCRWSCKTVSTLHAEIIEVGRSLVIRDLGSTNGTYVNGRRLKDPWRLPKTTWCSSPICRSASACNRPSTTLARCKSACDRALALVLFDKLMAEHAVTPFLQPIVDLKDRKDLGL